MRCRFRNKFILGRGAFSNPSSAMQHTSSEVDFETMQSRRPSRKYEWKSNKTKIVFEKFHFRDGLVWTGGLTGEIKLLVVDSAYDRSNKHCY